VDAAGASLLAGALAEAGGAGVWLATGAVAEAAPWWLAFLVLTIAGERRELARILMPHRGARWAYAGLLVSILAALATGLVAPETGTRMLGAGFLLLGLWLLRWDMATRTVRRPGLSRFMGLALLLGHGWLAIGGLLGVLHGDIGSGPLYDARIHAITLGFVFSMIFAHAPVILPALVHRALPFRPWFHVHLALLHATLALRVTGDLAQGDGAAWAADARLAGGLGNAGAILLFLITTVLALRPASRSNPVTRPG
jgi:hypothetical protein